MIGFLGIGRHNRLRTLLSSSVDGQVAPAEATQLEKHLAVCDECRRDLEDLGATVGLLRQLPELEVPRSFVLEGGPATIRGTGAHAWTTGLATSMAALVLVALLLGDVFGLLTQVSEIGVERPEGPAEAPAAAPMAAVALPAPAPVPAPAPAPRAAAAQPRPTPAPQAAAPLIAAAAAPAEAAPVEMAAAPPTDEEREERAVPESEAAPPVAAAQAVTADALEASDLE